MIRKSFIILCVILLASTLGCTKHEVKTESKVEVALPETLIGEEAERRVGETRASGCLFW